MVTPSEYGIRWGWTARWLGAAVVLLLSACSNDDDHVATTAKFDTYVQGYNLLQIYALEDGRNYWHRIDLTRGVLPDGAYRGVDELKWKAALEALKTGRAIDAGNAREADTAAEELIAHLEPLQSHMAGMDAYFESGAHRQDGFAQARAADPAVRTAYEGALRARDKMSAALIAHQNERDQAQAERYRLDGNLTGYHMTVVRLYAADLIDRAAAGDMARADTLAKQIEHSLMALRVERSKNPNDDTPALGVMMSGYGSILNQYQTLKQYRQPYTLEMMVRSYNLTLVRSNVVAP